MLAMIPPNDLKKGEALLPTAFSAMRNKSWGKQHKIVVTKVGKGATKIILRIMIADLSAQLTSQNYLSICLL